MKALIFFSQIPTSTTPTLQLARNLATAAATTAAAAARPRMRRTLSETTEMLTVSG